MGILDSLGLGSLVSKLSKPLSGSSNVTLGIDVGAASIKVVQLKKERGTIVLETYGEVALGHYGDLSEWDATNLAPEVIANALKEIFNEARVTAGSAGYGIASAASLINVIDFPASLSDKDLASAVLNEARKYVPVPLTEVSLDWWPVPSRRPDDESVAPTSRQVLIAAVHKDTGQKYQAIAAASGKSVGFMEIEMFASMRALLKNELQTVALVDLGATSTRVGIVDGGVLKVLVNIPRGGVAITRNLASSLNIDFVKAEEIKRSVGVSGSSQDFPEASDIIATSTEYILGEIQSVILGFEKRYRQPVARMVLTGGGAALKGLDERMSQKFQTSVEVARPFVRAKTPEFLNPILDRVGASFSVAMGLALRPML